MECPKCGLEIDDKAMVCPNCKKVLKLSCPICKTINEENICKKCGYVIISKCHECGKVNQTASKKCKKCGFDTEKSVIMNESNADDFVILTMDFPNMDEMKNLLGSAKLYNKFKSNLDNIIKSYTKSIGLRRQLIGSTYVIRFYKDYTFNSSAMAAVSGAVELLNRITTMNCKLTKKKNATVRCNIFLQKRSIEDDPYKTDSGFNISLLNQTDASTDKILNTFQVLTDENVVDAISKEYKVSPLNSVMVDDEMLMFYEVDLRDLVQFEYPEEEDDGEIVIPNFVQNMLLEQDKVDGEALNRMSGKKDPDQIYDIDSLTFDEINCEFIRTENADVLFHVLCKLQSNPRAIVAVKTLEIYKPYSIKVLNTVAETGNFDNIITVTCPDDMNCVPYAFFRNLISTIFDYSISQNLENTNDYSVFNTIDPDGLIKDLMQLNIREYTQEDIRSTYFDIFYTLMQIIPKSLIYIEDFDKIDDSSYDIMQFIFKELGQLEVSFLLSYNNDFSLHKDCHFLLARNNYTEISLKPTSFESFIENNRLFYQYILNDFYFQRIAKYSCGSSLFIDYAIQYLIESGVYEVEGESIKMVNPKTIIIPSNLDKLMARRLNLLQDDVEATKFLTTIALLGARVDLRTVDSLQFKNQDAIIEKLTDLGYVYEYSGSLYFPNYNLMKRNLLSTISKIAKEEIAIELFEKVLTLDNPDYSKAFLYGLIKDYDAERSQWEQIAKIALSLGDFRAYINCAEKIIDLLDYSTEDNSEYKSKIYEEISNNLIDYIPSKYNRIAQMTLKNIEKTGDVEKIIMLCNRMIDGTLNAGDYNQTLELTHKVLALLPSSSLNPADKNFNTYFYLMSLIHVQILFNIGSFPDCIDLGYKVLGYVNSQMIPFIKPDYFTEERFVSFVVDTIGYIALTAILMLGYDVKEFLSIASNIVPLPQSYSLFLALQDFIRGADVSLDGIEIAEGDRFGGAIYNIINAFKQDDYNTFAEYAHKAKIYAKELRLHQVELFADLLVGYAYIKADMYEKAEIILNNILKDADKNGMTFIIYSAWYLIAEVNLRRKDLNVANGILSNTLIQIEKNSNTSEYLLMLFKYSMFKVQMYLKEFDKAEICINHARYIAAKYGINFNFDIDPSHYIYREENTEENINENVEETVQERESE